MRVFKPLQLSLLTKIFSWEKKDHLAVTLLLGFPFDNNNEVLLEQDLWSRLPDLLGDYPMLDACMPKPQGEVIVYGSYYSPEGKPVTADEIQLQMGTVDKKLAVIGNRYWRTLLAPTDPEPFTELPISYEYAFGGKEYKKNPTGKGMDEVDVFGEMRLPMPNIEDTDNLITSTDHRPDSAGLGPLDMMWEQRAVKTGTYDETWQRDYFPGYPPDLDWSHFNTAPPDQWIEEFWQGNESFQLLNMHPSKPQVGGRLPAFRTRCFIEKQIEKGVLFTEVEMHAETVCLFPNVETGVLIYRGVIEVAEDDATDVEHLLVAYEDLAQSPRSKDYYDEALRNRLDESKVFKYMMYTKDIIPESERCGFARMLDDVDMSGDSELAKNLDARAEAEKQKALEMLEQQKQQLKEKLEAANIDPAPYLKKFEIKDDLPDDPHIKGIMETMEKILPGSTQGDAKNIKVEEVDFGKFDELNEKMDAMAEAKKEDAKQQLRDVIKKVEGTEAEQQVREKVEAALKQMDELPDLPRPAGDEMLENLKQQLEKVEEAKEKMRAQGIPEDQLPEVDISLEEVEQKMQEAFVQMKDMYRSGAHYVDGKPPHKEPMDIIQYRFKKFLDKGESLAGRDLSGVDFSGLDLSGMDLSGCYLEYTNFSNTNLRGANLKRAIITHADLTNTDLTGAMLEECNLGASRLNGTVIANVDFGEAVLSKSDLSNAKFTQCDLREVNFLEAVMTGVVMTDCKLQGAIFLEMNFTGSRFLECELRECNFLQSQLEHCDFSNSDLSGSNFVECKLDNSRFVEANMTNVRFPAGCSLRNCNFDKAKLDKANLRDTEAENSRFEFASFNQADFSGANLQNTKFYGAVGKRAMFMKSDLGGADFSSVNLMEGSLMKARLTNADLSYSNFYAVEFMNATVGGTDFTGANLDLSKLENWSPPK
ncbi:MAG: DUF2169 domain-containing protein [Gammaproteobacteria bacterium]|nr:DUF2169 domain-containing protein [Gammaproteobacteria bacterium]